MPLTWMLSSRPQYSVFIDRAQAGKPVCTPAWPTEPTALDLSWVALGEPRGPAGVHTSLIAPWRGRLCTTCAHPSLPATVGKGDFLPLPPATRAPPSALCTAHIQLGLAQPEWETPALDFKALSEPTRFAGEAKEKPVNEHCGQKMGVGKGGCCGRTGSKRADEDSTT